jgi:hypothetical protein
MGQKILIFLSRVSQIFIMFDQKRMESESDIIGMINRRNGKLFQKGLSENFFRKSFIKNGGRL